jgi:hypothetical protein
LQEYKKHYLRKNQLLSYAAYSGDVGILQFFLQKANVNNLNVFYDPFEAPPLHLAVEGTFITFFWENSQHFNDYLHCNDFHKYRIVGEQTTKKRP